MSSAPRVSAIVPAYNAARWLSLALDSFLAQTFSDSEAIVVDDGSKDDTAAIAARYAERYPDRIRLLRQENSGLCGARNPALAAARGEYCALLDSDDEWLPHHLERSVAALDADPALGLVHANIERIDDDGRTLHVPPRYWRDGDDAFARILLREEHVSCPTVVFRRALLQQVGPFDMQFNRLGCEDRDLWLRIALVAPLRFLPAVHALYRHHDSNMSANTEKMERARRLLIEKFAATPRGAALKRRAFAALHAGSGDEHMNAGRRRAAFGAYLRAFAQAPSLRAAKQMVRCVVA
jgi:glycosyltransferase involved in cell wall biosynthesis